MNTTYSKNMLVDLEKTIPTIKLDIRYATKNNFTGQAVYAVATGSPVKCFLQEPAAQALKKVQEELASLGLGLKVFDGYRPHRVQFIFWDLMPDPRYVADPKKGSRHNRGCAVDLTLVKLDDTELLMPTEFDDFTERAHNDYMNLPAEAIANRKLLRDIMEKHGFINIPTEWWHFDYKDWERYPILDIPLEEL